MRLKCPRNSSHKEFRRESYDNKDVRVNVEIVDEYGRFFGDPLDLYTGDVRYRYWCAKCGAEALEEKGANPL